MRELSKNDIKRFWSKVNKSAAPPSHAAKLGRCWEWVRNKYTNGYGQFQYGGFRVPGVLAHRVSYFISIGPIPDGLCVLHKCDNRSCVRPSHLFVGTKSQNTIDAVRKGRHKSGSVTHPHRLPRGVDVHGAKLDQKRVKAIRKLLNGTTKTLSEIGSRFGVSRQSVAFIRDGATWRHVK